MARRPGPAALVLVALALVAAPAASSAAPAAIVYQCGSDVQICAISPSGGTPTTLAQSGYLAGVTSDGATYGYLAPSGGIWEAPVAGGVPTEVNSAAQASPIAAMSADGALFLTTQALDFGQFVYRYSVAAGPSSGYTSVDSTTTATMTFGWLGDTPLTTHSGYGFEPPSWVCIGGQASGYCGQGATSPQIASQTANVTFPSGSPDGAQVVAALAAPERDAGSIALFSAATGEMIRTIATPPAGTAYSVPRFSPDGTQVTFESDPLDAGGNEVGPASIDIVDLDGNGLRTIAQGSDPSWGGSDSPSPAPVAGPTPSPGPRSGPIKLPPAPKVTLKLPAQTLAGVRRAGYLQATCALAAAGRCTVKATISAAAARALGLKVTEKAKAYPLAHASRKLTQKGAADLRLKLAAKVRAALARAEALRVMLTATSTAPEHGPNTRTGTVTLR
ncbi:MAG: hypothetical protein J0H06_07905 [Actinobacteria bacterium]|nr:hypothetical protein [Actinomycetota bacterium]